MGSGKGQFLGADGAGAFTASHHQVDECGGAGVGLGGGDQVSSRGPRRGVGAKGVSVAGAWRARRPRGTDGVSGGGPRGELTLPGKGPGSSSFSACLFSSARRALQFSHQTPRSEPGDEPPPLPEPGEPVPKPGEPPREPGELVPMPGEAGPGEPVNELGDDVPEPGDGVPDEPSAEPAPSGVGRLAARDSS